MEQEQKEKLKNLSNNQLIDVVKNYRQYGYEESLRDAALILLEERGLSQDYLKHTGNLENINYRRAKEIYMAFTSDNKKALISYILILISFFFQDAMGIAGLLLTLLFIVIFYVYLIKALIQEDNFNKCTQGKTDISFSIFFVLFGAPVFLVSYFYYKDKMGKKLQNLV